MTNSNRFIPTLEGVQALAEKWHRPDLVEKFLRATAGQWPLILSEIAVEVAEERAQEVIMRAQQQP